MDPWHNSLEWLEVSLFRFTPFWQQVTPFWRQFTPFRSEPGREQLNHTFVPSISQNALKHVVALDILPALLQRYMVDFACFLFGEQKAKVHNYKKWVKRAELLLLEQLKFHVLDPLQCAKEMRFLDASKWARTFQKHVWSTHFGKTPNATKNTAST